VTSFRVGSVFICSDCGNDLDSEGRLAVVEGGRDPSDKNLINSFLKRLDPGARLLTGMKLDRGTLFLSVEAIF
jgi:hypothetical protein